MPPSRYIEEATERLGIEDSLAAHTAVDILRVVHASSSPSITTVQMYIAEKWYRAKQSHHANVLFTNVNMPSQT